MKQIKHYIIALAIVFLGLPVQMMAQDSQTKQLTKEQVLSMTIEELSSLPLEELMQAIDVAGVNSMEELFELLLNKNVKSVSKKVENAFDSPLSSTVLSRSEIESSGATTFEEALKLVPGVIVREKTNGNFDVHLRGFDNLPPKNMLISAENTSTLVMIDGRPVFNYVFGGTLWETLPIGLGDVDRIEVVRGPSSALYGPNAVTGVINIITRQVDEETPLVSVDMQGGNLSSYIGNIGIRKKINEKWSASLTANVDRRDRVTDQLYILTEKMVMDNDPDKTSLTRGYYDKADYEHLQKDVNGQYFYLMDRNDDVDDWYPNPERAKEKYGANGFLSFKPKSDVQFDLATGFQYSFVNSSSLADNVSSMTGRDSRTGYFDFSGRYKQLQFKTNYAFGPQTYVTGNNGYKQDMEQFSVSAEYDWQIKSLNIRPGVSYQYSSTDDSPYLKEEEVGFFNGQVKNSALSASVRFDYLTFNKLRLVAALRAETYEYPEDIYGSWQFAATLPLNDKHLIRAVYSRANRSAFLLDTHADYIWEREGREPPANIYFGGNKDVDLMTTDMVELGYRGRPAKNILVDVEAFYSKAKNFTAFMPDSTFTVRHPLVPSITLPYYANITYSNLDLTAQQIGVSVSVDWIVSEKLFAKANVTVQETKLDNYYPYSRDELIGYQYLVGKGVLDQNAALPGVGITNLPENTESDVKHEATPSVWGTLGLVYKPIEKLEISSFGHFIGQQQFTNMYGTVDLKDKFTLNAKASYHVTKNVKVFVNARNLFNNTEREFAYMDETNGLYLVGASLKF